MYSKTSVRVAGRCKRLSAFACGLGYIRFRRRPFCEALLRLGADPYLPVSRLQHPLKRGWLPSLFFAYEYRDANEFEDDDSDEIDLHDGYAPSVRVSPHGLFMIVGWTSTTANKTRKMLLRTAFFANDDDLVELLSRCD